MNTRLQVEHPVTELVTGIDLVRTQIEIAQGNPLPFKQADITFRGHAIECRINAEDAARGFLPRPGTVSAYREPSGPGVRVDSGIEAGSVASPFYDPLLAKLIVWDEDRERATRRMLRALDEFRIDGLKTLIPFHKTFLATEEWVSGGTGHRLLADKAFLSTIGANPAPVVRAAE
jgi:acetyl-CoA/propionyl-CoA carboxylase biotin carboxyl carrier protein